MSGSAVSGCALAGATGAEPSHELPVQEPVPLGMELIAASGSHWFVSYFRWQGELNRFFFGGIDWSCEPAAIREISRVDELTALP